MLAFMRDIRDCLDRSIPRGALRLMRASRGNLPSVNGLIPPRAPLGLLVAACLCVVSACDGPGKPNSGVPPPVVSSISVHSFGAQEYSGVVVEDDDGSPIGGVNVVAYWWVASGMESGHITNIAVIETVTDASAKSLIPAWGAKPVSQTAGLHSTAPTPLFFKAGYSLGGGEGLGLYSASTYVGGGWDGKTFRLKKFEGSSTEYMQYLNTYLGVHLNGFARDCFGKEIPRLFLAVDGLTQNQPSARLSSTDYSTSYLRKCGPFTSHSSDKSK